MRLLRAFSNARHADDLLDIAKQQQHLIRELRYDKKRLQLDNIKTRRDLLLKFRIALEADWDIRDELDAAISDLEDEVARREEHLV